MKNRYFGKILVSILWQNTSIDTQITSQKSPSQTSHPQVSHIFWLPDFKFFRFLRHLPRFPVVCILDFYFFWGWGANFGHYSSDNTKYWYLNNILIFNDTKKYRKYRYYFSPLNYSLPISIGWENGDGGCVVLREDHIRIHLMGFEPMAQGVVLYRCVLSS